MARRDDIGALHALAEIRAAQTAAARARLAQALKSQSEAEANVEATRGLQAQRTEAWIAVASAARLDLPLAQAWGRSLLDGEAELARLSDDATGAQQRCETARGRAQTAAAHQDAADEVARTAERRHRRSRDEAALARAEERFQQRRVVR